MCFFSPGIFVTRTYLIQKHGLLKIHETTEMRRKKHQTLQRCSNGLTNTKIEYLDAKNQLSDGKENKTQILNIIGSGNSRVKNIFLIPNCAFVFYRI